MLRLLKIFVAAFFETHRARLRHGRTRPSWNFQFEWVVRFLWRGCATISPWYDQMRDPLGATMTLGEAERTALRELERLFLRGAP